MYIKNYKLKVSFIRHSNCYYWLSPSYLRFLTIVIFTLACFQFCRLRGSCCFLNGSLACITFLFDLFSVFFRLLSQFFSTLSPITWVYSYNCYIYGYNLSMLGTHTHPQTVFIFRNSYQSYPIFLENMVKAQIQESHAYFLIKMLCWMSRLLLQSAPTPLGFLLWA